MLTLQPFFFSFLIIWEWGEGRDFMEALAYSCSFLKHHIHSDFMILLREGVF